MISIFIVSLCSNKHSSPQARTEYLRRKARAALQPAGGRTDDEQSESSGALEHLNLFPLEESSEKMGNEEYLKEKKDEKVLVLLLFLFSYMQNSHQQSPGRQLVINYSLQCSEDCFPMFYLSKPIFAFALE